MSPISRTDAAERLARTRAVQARESPGKPAPQRTQSPPASPPFDADEDLARRVAAIARDDADRPRRIARAFLESCVARTFGTAAAQDPAFRHVVEQAQAAMAADPALAAAMARVVERLEADAAAPPAP
jgi:hypothetical protein